MSTPHTTAQCERDEHDFRFPVDSYGVPMTDGRYCSNCDRCEHCFREDRALELLASDDDAKIPDHDACPNATPDSEQEDYDADRLASAPCEDCGVLGHTADHHNRPASAPIETHPIVEALCVVATYRTHLNRARLEHAESYLTDVELSVDDRRILAEIQTQIAELLEVPA